jgi:Tetratricopeptide repeat
MNNLAWEYQVAGRLSDALPLCEETLKRTKAQLGPDDPRTLTTMHILAEVHRAAGRYSNALALLEATLKGF